ncbi:MAG: leucine-rich repeat protein [Oscillospiraceae bacterium]|nr:leucine-rich repeat protein [Oscillospiraceae bacterium]
MKHRITAGLTALLMLGTAAPMTGLPLSTGMLAVAEEGEEGEQVTYGDLTFTKYADYAEVTDCDEKAETVEIPAEIDDLPVTVIGSEAFYATWVQSVTIPDSVTRIRHHAFCGCNNLYQIEIPDSVTVMDANVFFECRNLETVRLPENIDQIPDETFCGCTSLTTVNIPPNITQIGHLSFSRTKLTEITIPDQVYIGSWAFKECEELQSVMFGKGGSLEHDCFAGCKSLTKVILPEGLEEIPDNAFYYATALKKVTIPETVKKIGYGAFSGSGLEEITLPKSVASVNGAILAGCTSLKTATFLNKDCEFYDAPGMCAETTVIRGYSDSTAQAYAEQYGYTFESLDGTTTEPTEPEPEPTEPELHQVENPVFADIVEMYRKNVSEKWANYKGKTATGILNTKELDSVSSEWLTTYKDKTPSEISYCIYENFLFISAAQSYNNYSLIEGYYYENGTITHLFSDTEKTNFVYTKVNSTDSEGDSVMAVWEIQDGSLVLTKAYKVRDLSTSYPIWKSICTQPEMLEDGTIAGEWEPCDEHDWGDMFLSFTPLSVVAPLTTEPATEPAEKASGTCGENLTWKLDDAGTLTVSGTGEMNADAVPWMDEKPQIKSIVIENGVTSIGLRAAFSGCTALTSVTIPDSVTSIGDNVFPGCTALQSITIPDSVTTIGEGLFRFCSSLTSVTLPDGLTSLGEEAFRGCEALESVAIPSGMTSIPKKAFCDCEKLTSVTFPESVTSIGESAFFSCDALTSFTIPDSVTSIGYDAFSSCYALESVTIPASVTTMGDAVFSDCRALTSVTIPDSVTSLGGGQFIACDVLQSVTLPAGLTSIGNNMFEFCSKLESVKIPDSVTSIGNRAFADCKALTSLTIPEGVESIGTETFVGCNGLESVTVPASVASISDRGFLTCRGLKTITILNPACEISDSADTICTGFDHKNNRYEFTGTIRGYEGSTAQTYAEKYGYTFEVIDGTATEPTEPINEPTWKLDDDGTLTISGTGKMSYLFKAPWEDYADSITKVIIEDGITSIGQYAFFGCHNLTSVTIPDSVTSIEKYAFCQCYVLTSVTIPDGVTSLGECVFYDCKSLTSVTIPDGVTSIPEQTFQNCNNLESVTIPDSVTSIGEAAFCFCKTMTSVTIPNSVTSIGYRAFFFCTALDSVTIPGSVTSIDHGAFAACPALTEIKVDGGSSYIAVDGVLLTADLKTLVQFPAGKADTSYTIPDGVASIDANAFYGCNDLTTITLPDSLTSIGAEAFSRCAGLTSITILNPECVIEDDSTTISNQYDTQHQVGAFEGVICGHDNSTAQAYAKKYGYTFKSLEGTTIEPTEQPLGDLDGDTTVNASDAAKVLIAAAAMGAGEASGLTEAQIKAADVNGDKTVNASDAAIILIYAAAVGAGNEDAKITDFVKK